MLHKNAWQTNDQWTKITISFESYLFLIKPYLPKQTQGIILSKQALPALQIDQDICITRLSSSNSLCKVVEKLQHNILCSCEIENSQCIQIENKISGTTKIAIKVLQSTSTLRH